jgi:hypothetical protein
MVVPCGCILVYGKKRMDEFTRTQTSVRKQRHTFLLSPETLSGFKTSIPLCGILVVLTQCDGPDSHGARKSDRLNTGASKPISTVHEPFALITAGISTMSWVQTRSRRLTEFRFRNARVRDDRDP